MLLQYNFNSYNMKPVMFVLVAVLLCASAFKVEVDELKKLGYKLEHSNFGDVVMSKVDGLNTQTVTHP